jgi:hypothetical protein
MFTRLLAYSCDLSELYAVAVQLDLVIDAPEEVQP